MGGGFLVKANSFELVVAFILLRMFKKNVLSSFLY